MDEAPRVDGRTLRYAGRREELLGLATAYVIEHGVANLSLRPLAQAIGISHSAITHHFGSKERLVQEILGLLREASTRLREHAGVADQRIDAWSAWWYTWSADQFLPALRFTWEVFGLALREPDKFQDFLDHGVRDFIPFVEVILQTEGCPADEIPSTARMMIAHMMGLQVDLLGTGERAEVDAAHERFVTMLNLTRATWTPPASTPAGDTT